MFKSKFSGWDEVIAVDFTRTAESVQKTGADLTKWARQQETKVCWKHVPFEDLKFIFPSMKQKL